MHHYYQIPDAEIPQVSERELLNMGFIRVGTATNSEGIYLVPCVDPCEGHPGVELASGFLQRRHENLPAEAKGRIVRARVFRGDRGFRLAVERSGGETIEPRKKAPAAVRERLRRMLAERAEGRRRARAASPAFRLLEVALADVEDDDVVDDDYVLPVVMAGEITRR